MQRNPRVMNINNEPVATRLMLDIKHQLDRVLVDILYQTFDIKHQPDRVLVDI